MQFRTAHSTPGQEEPRVIGNVDLDRSGARERSIRADKCTFDEPAVGVPERRILRPSGRKRSPTELPGRPHTHASSPLTTHVRICRRQGATGATVQPNRPRKSAKHISQTQW